MYYACLNKADFADADGDQLREYCKNDKNPIRADAREPGRAARMIAEILKNADSDPDEILEFYIEDEDRGFSPVKFIRSGWERRTAIRTIMDKQPGEIIDLIIARLLYSYAIPLALIIRFCHYYRPGTDYREIFLLGTDTGGTGPRYTVLRNPGESGRSSPAEAEILRDPPEKVADFLDDLATALGKSENCFLVADRNPESLNASRERDVIDCGKGWEGSGWIMKILLKYLALRPFRDLQKLITPEWEQDSYLFDVLRDEYFIYERYSANFKGEAGDQELRETLPKTRAKMLFSREKIPGSELFQTRKFRDNDGSIITHADLYIRCSVAEDS